jgi:hypothetical protein
MSIAKQLSKNFGRNAGKLQAMRSLAPLARNHGAFLFPRGQTPQTMAPPSKNPSPANIGSSPMAMVPFGCPRYRGIVNPSGLCISGLASAEGLNFSRSTSDASPRDNRRIAATVEEGTALKPVQVNARVQRNSGEAHSFSSPTMSGRSLQSRPGGRLQLLPPRNATPLPSRSFLGWQSSSMVAGGHCSPLIACLDGGKSFIRKRKSARCGESPTAPILAENFSPAWCPGRSTEQTCCIVQLAFHETRDC